jgi:hypothetical protein
LNRTIALGATRRRGSLPPVKLNPRNFRSFGRATALFAWFTLSLSFRRVLSECFQNVIEALNIRIGVDKTFIGG